MIEATGDGDGNGADKVEKIKEDPQAQGVAAQGEGEGGGGGDGDGEEDPPSVHLVLYLRKAPSVEWFPGCEWWDRVFADDEPIDTSVCTVG